MLRTSRFKSTFISSIVACIVFGIAFAASAINSRKVPKDSKRLSGNPALWVPQGQVIPKESIKPIFVKDERVSQELISKLAAIAEEALTVQYQTLVSGDIDNSLKNKPLARLHKNAMMNTYKFQVDRRNRLKKTKIDIKGFQTSIHLNEVIGDGLPTQA